MKKFLSIILFLTSTLLLAQVITPIANIQDSVSVYNGESVTVQGVITIGAGVTNDNLLNAFIQDNSGKGIMLFAYDITPAYQNDLIRGNSLQVSGIVDEYNGVTELKDFSYSVISTGNPEPSPTILDMGENNNLYEGTLVQVTGTIYEIYFAGGGTNINIEDENGNQLTIRVWDSTGIILDDYYVGFILEAVGAGSIYASNFQILAGYDDHLREGEFVNYPYGEISEVIPGQPVNITFSYPLQMANVILNWKTSSSFEFNMLEMLPNEINENIFEATVPAQGQGTIVEFYITATDTANTEQYVFPEGYPQVSAYFYTYSATTHSAVLNIPAKTFNPYDGETFPIEFASKNGDKAILRVYNAEGKLMRTLVNTIISNSTGIIHYDWNGKDVENKLLPLGLYICFLEVIDTANGNKKTAKAPIVIGAPLK
ncbi:MAG: hypothetical protein K9M99_13075 [Candidatus Cloacimonetes bacterium]|nr:hypothetical protein [Candidatus Cloacimonadota bacterium]